MLQARIFLILLGFVLPQICVAGAWPRGEGNQFLSVSVEFEFENGLTDGQDLFAGLFYERGLANDLTLGFDAGSDPTGSSKAFGFLRWSAGPQDGPSRLAFEFGVGAFDERPAIRPGVSWGRGITLGDIGGWISVDTRYVLQDSFDSTLESDFTFGLRPGPRGMVIFQLQTGLPDDDGFFAKIAPSYVHEFRPDRRIEIGLISGITGIDDFKVKLGLWRDF